MKAISLPVTPNSSFRRAGWSLSAAGLAVVAAAVIFPGAASASTGPTIGYGSEGAAVRDWQADLDRVRPSASLAIDGGVGPVTWVALTRELGADTTRACATAQLRATLGAGDGTAGSVYVPLELTNIGAEPCATGGYPGVSSVTGNAGRQVGSPAVWVATVKARTVTLAAGQTATATLREVEAGNFPSCRITTTRGLRVYPPNQTTALFVAQPGRGCANPAVTDLYATAFQPAA